MNSDNLIGIDCRGYTADYLTLNQTNSEVSRWPNSVRDSRGGQSLKNYYRTVT